MSGLRARHRRVLGMVRQMDAEGFGHCTVTGSCSAVCPKEISLDFITRMNRDYLKALLHLSVGRKEEAHAGAG